FGSNTTIVLFNFEWIESATIVGIDVVNDLYGHNMLIGWLRWSSA
ncbi:21388_t:CDS:2, partial [Racocetra persica]